MLPAVLQQNSLSMREEVRWRLHADARLRWRYWDEECVLFHGAAGNTHRIAQPVGQLLEALVSGEATADNLSESIDLELADVQLALQEMRRLGIVECLE